jgi:CheY-like chemotaxis protein
MFMQVDRSLERAHSGLGIGLTRVKRGVELHGGSVQAHSDGPGRGSEFTIRLPLFIEEEKGRRGDGETKIKTDPISSSPPLPFSSTDSFEKLRVLVVDDNRDAADTLALLLRIQGAEVCTAHDGLEAVQAAGEFRPAVVVLDIGLPRLHGYDAARRIRQLPGGSDLVLIAMTGWGQDGDKKRAKEAGFDHHLVKLVDPMTLMQLLGSLDRTANRMSV